MLADGRTLAWATNVRHHNRLVLRRGDTIAIAIGLLRDRHTRPTIVGGIVGSRGRIGWTLELIVDTSGRVRMVRATSRCSCRAVRFEVCIST